MYSLEDIRVYSLCGIPDLFPIWLSGFIPLMVIPIYPFTAFPFYSLGGAPDLFLWFHSRLIRSVGFLIYSLEGIPAYSLDGNPMYSLVDIPFIP